jgi:hypothetical protein
LLLAGVLWSTTLFSDVIKVDILPTKISTDVKLIVYSGQTVVFERYHFFKYNYWMSALETLETLNNGMLQGKGIVINPAIFKVTVDGCDSTVNRLETQRSKKKCRHN